MDNDTLHTLAQTMMPDEDWQALFTADALKRFEPQRGSRGWTPILEAHCWDHGARSIVVMMLAIDDFNTWETRMALMRRLGEKWEEERYQVCALRMGTEAWMRSFTPEEAQARGDRLVASYDDKQEVMLVSGRTIDGRTMVASAPLYRDKVGRIRAVGTWTTAPARIQPYILETAMESYLRAMGQRLGYVQHPH